MALQLRSWYFSGILAMALVGCGKQEKETSNAERIAAQEKIAAIAAGNTGAADNQLEPDSETSNVFTHPIDNLPEGLRFRAAVTAIDNGNLKAASEIREELKASPQYSPLATAIDALVMVKQNKFEEAIGLAEEISAIPVMQAEAYVIAAEVFQRQNRLMEAISALNSALEINPQHIRAHLLIGALYYDTGAMRLATGHLRSAAGLAPDNANALLLSGKIHKEYEQYQEAITDYQEALKRVDSEQLELHARVEMAMCQCELRQLEEAKATLEPCPEVAAVLAARAAISEATGEFDLATQQARQALELSPQNRVASLVLGRILVTQREWAKAVKLLSNLVEAAPYDHEPRLLYGRALVGSGEPEQGKSEIEAATELKDVFLKFADLHQEAITKPNDAAIRVQLGKLAEKLGKFNLARTWYQAAVGLEASNQDALDALARLQQ